MIVHRVRCWMTLAGLLMLPMVGVSQLQTTTMQAGQSVDAVVVVVTRFGPYPASFTHSPSPFVLAIVNRSGVLDDTYSLVLKPALSSSGGTASTTSLLDLHSTSSTQRDHQLIQPLAGGYQLIFRSHPDWTVNISIGN